MADRLTPAEFAARLETLRPALERCARSSLRPADAEDAVADAVAAALRSLYSFDPATGASGLERWLRAILEFYHAHQHVALIELHCLVGHQIPSAVTLSTLTSGR